MAHNFNNVPRKTFQGAAPQLILSPQGGNKNAGWLTASIDWSKYGVSVAVPSIAIPFTFGGTNSPRQFGKCLSVRIDNTAVATSSYVFFPDTGYVVVAPPDSIVTENVISDAQTVLLIGQGFTNAAPGQTNFFFANFCQQNFFDPEITQATALWLASANPRLTPTIFNTNLGTPALGDQQVSFLIPLSNASFNVLPQLNLGFYYFTHVFMRLVNLPNPPPVGFDLKFQSGNPVQTWLTVNCTASNGGDITPIYSQPMQLKIDATLGTLVLTNNGPSGQGEVYISVIYSSNPN